VRSSMYDFTGALTKFTIGPKNDNNMLIPRSSVASVKLAY